MLEASRFGLPGHIVAARQGKTQHQEMLYKNWRQRGFRQDGRYAGIFKLRTYKFANKWQAKA